MRNVAPVTRDLVFVGGGHAHALALRTLAMRPVPGLRVTLISPAPFTPYSGMLPGLLAGHYSFEDAHIDLVRFCQWAGVRFFCDEVVALDPEAQVLRCRERGDVGYDILSLDIGSQPELDSVPGARQYSVPVKPVAGLWQRWQTLQEEDAVGRGDTGPDRLAVVGGGAGSVEIALAIAHRFRGRPVDIALYSAASELLPGYGSGTRSAVEAQCDRLGVRRLCDHRVARVEDGTLHFEAAPSAGFDTVFWCTGAAAAPWVAESGLDVDERGFMTVHDTLESTSTENVFGAGDIAVQVAHPRPKAGVYAVRQAPVLAHNLRARALGATLREHRPQSRFLSLLSLGPQEAVGERGWFSARGSWVWRWKDRIDRKFMQQFLDLPERDMEPPPAAAATAPAQAPCGGCGAKVGGLALREALQELRQRHPEYAPSGELDDAALVDAGQALLQSTDQLRALQDDPWLMGRIAAQHALSDVYACGARPHSALAQFTLAFAAEPLLRRDLRAALDGALGILGPAGCALLGGHTMQGPEMQLGFTVNAVLDGQPPLRKRGAQPGDLLLLTGALGSGALFAAHMQLRADGRDVYRALQSMQEGNGEAAAIARRCGAHAVTDVTGFGLAGHLLEMLGENRSARLDLDALPALPGAAEALEEGIVSTLHDSNRSLVAGRMQLPREPDAVAEAREQLLCDPQTSGGLLMALPAAAAESALTALHEAGRNAVIVGEVGGAPAALRETLRLR